jgi:hypothetical protein
MIWEGRGRSEEGGIENTLKVRQIGRETAQMTLAFGAGLPFARILPCRVFGAFDLQGGLQA